MALQTKTAQLKVVDRGIVKTVLFRNAQLCELDAIENFLTEAKLFTGHPHCVLIDERLDAKTSVEAKSFEACKKVSETRIAAAKLVSTRFRKFISTIELKLNKPATPTRVFLKEKDALEWLRKEYNKN